jgi:hypothetical protein
MTLIFLLILGVFVILSLVTKMIYNFNFKKEAQQVLSNSENAAEKKFSYDQLKGLPEPVQRYFKNVLLENQSYINTIRLKHIGQFKTGINKNWVDIRGQQYYNTQIPSFIWKGKIGLICAKDMYLNGKGKLIIKLFHLFTIKKAEGRNYDQGELLRWLGESVWFPTNLLPSDRLQWHAINETSAKITLTYNTLSLFYIVTFNENDQICKLETKRYYENNTLKTWIGECFKYKEINGVKVPTVLKASWIINKIEHNYALFQLEEIEYNKNEVY